MMILPVPLSTWLGVAVMGCAVMMSFFGCFLHVFICFAGAVLGGAVMHSTRAVQQLGWCGDVLRACFPCMLPPFGGAVFFPIA